MYFHIHEVAIDAHRDHNFDSHLAVGAGNALFAGIDRRLVDRNLNF